MTKVETRTAVIASGVDCTLVLAADADFNAVTGIKIAGDLRLTLETEARARRVIGEVVDVGLFTVVPPANGLVDLTVNGERNLGVALACRRGSAKQRWCERR